MSRTTRIVGKILFVWGSIASFSGVISLFSGSNPGNSFGMLIFAGIIPLLIGRSIMKKSKKTPLEIRDSPMMERRVLLLASNSKGRFTLTEATLQMNLSIEMTRKVLESFVTKGLIEVEVDDNGVQHYIYRDIYLKQ